MNQNRFWALRFAAKLFFLLLLLLLIVFPIVMHLLGMFGRYPISLMAYVDKIQWAQTWAMRIIGLLWIFFLGSCFASFLNVVAWRVPRGRGINGSSHCPHCDVKLKFTDNLPVIGWIRIGGMCRNCKAPVTPRYLIVEIILGLIFAVVFVTEVLSGGINLPLRPANYYRGFEHLVLDPKWDLIQLWAFQMVLVCFLFTFAVIRSEKLKIPQSIFWVAIAMGLGLPLIWPNMLLVPWQFGVEKFAILQRFSSTQLLTMLIGVDVGALCGLIVWWTRSKQNDLFVALRSNLVLLAIPESIACFSLVGLFLGWQSAVVITTISLFLLILFRLLESLGNDAKSDILKDPLETDWYNPNPTVEEETSTFERVLGKNPSSNLSAFVLAATVLHLLTWRFSNCLPGWPTGWQPWLEICLAILALTGLAITLHRKLSFKLTS